jgi:deoxyribodipyrimidine photolyase-related protein
MDMAAIRLIFGDQLSHTLASLREVGRDDVVLMVEVKEEGQIVPHHKQKIAFILSAMRHFAEELRANNIRVDYVRLDDKGNSQNFAGEIKRALKRHGLSKLICTWPGEWRVLTMLHALHDDGFCDVVIFDDDRFLASRSRFAQWSEGKKALRMEYFYRDMRRATGLLMEGDEPAGGAWNFDHDNRKPIPAKKTTPSVQRFDPDAITSEVIALVEHHFPDHMGDLKRFGWGVTRKDALAALKNFVTFRLSQFGDYQDAMRAGSPFMFHSVLAPYLNIGLLSPYEVCAAAQDAWKKGRAPLNAVEGFVRQILGWREYVRALYWHFMPAYQNSNALDAHRPLPSFYWTGETDMHCLARVVDDTKRYAYSHHIQRLMVTGNFALLAGLDPREVEAWYLAVYADAFEWVELPNTHGMALFADGGVMASKPYAASGAYINRMSHFCGDCRYDPKVKLGENACPFNYLYWYFLMTNAAKLKSNPRMGMPYKTLAGMTPAHKKSITQQAQAFLDDLN